MFAGNKLKSVAALCLKLVGAKLLWTLKVLLERKVLAGTYCSRYDIEYSGSTILKGASFRWYF